MSEKHFKLQLESYFSQKPTLTQLCLLFVRVYIDNKLDPLVATTQIPHSPLDLLALELRYFGASIEPILTNNISHVIIDNG